MPAPYAASEASSFATVDRGHLLRELIRALSKSGMTYGEIVDSLPSGLGWTANAIKQLSLRNGQMRMTSRVEGLASAISELAEQQITTGKLDASLDFHVKSLRNIRRASTGLAHQAIEDSISNKFRALHKRTALDEHLPENFTFIRYGRDGKKIIFILIETVQTPGGYCFSMKISGNHDAKRIVLGQILATKQNTYFTGIAYRVQVAMSDVEFRDLDALDTDEVARVASMNDIGVETLAVSNNLISFPVSPVYFTGLDGSGKPISGMGVFVIAEAYDQYDIGETVTSDFICTRENQKLNEMLKKYGAVTNASSPFERMILSDGGGQ